LNLFSNIPFCQLFYLSITVADNCHIKRCTYGQVLSMCAYVYIYTGCPRMNVPDFGRVCSLC